MKRLKLTSFHSKKITAEQAKQLSLVPMGGRHPVRGLLETLEVGEILRISKADLQWRNGVTPNYFIRQIEKRTGRKFRMQREVGGTG
jgi:hypothetical protein